MSFFLTHVKVTERPKGESDAVKGSGVVVVILVKSRGIDYTKMEFFRSN